MNYWVTPSGQYFEGHTNLSWHTSFGQYYLDKFEEVQDRYYDWYNNDNESKDLIDFFEQELRWVRYCDWGSFPGWIIPIDRRLTKSQREVIFKLTGDIIK